MSEIKNVAIIVSSCDAFSDAWKPFFTLFYKYWHDCPFNVYLIANTINYSDQRVKTICVGTDLGWSSNLQKALHQIAASTILYFQEDYFIKKNVKTELVLSLINKMRKYHAACLRLYPSPGPDSFFENEGSVGIISRDAAYRVSLQCSIWNSDTLESLLVPGENGWDMETKGTQRASGRDELFLSVKRSGENGSVGDIPIDYLCTAIVKGRWTKEAVELCGTEGIKLDLKLRPVLKGKPYENNPSLARRILTLYSRQRTLKKL